MNSLDHDTERILRLTNRSLRLTLLTVASLFGGIIAVTLGPVCAGLFDKDQSSAKARYWNASSGWFPGWPTWTIAVTAAGAVLLLIAGIGFLFMKRNGAKLRALMERVRADMSTS